MNVLPNSVTPYKRTREFTELSIPKGLLNDHQTKEGAWGKIVVLEGCLEYTIIEPELEIIELTTSKFGVVEPTILHHIKPLGKVNFYVEFYR